MWTWLTFFFHQSLINRKIFFQIILDVVAKNCVDIAKDKCGCCSIQKCIEYDELPAFMQLVNKLIFNAVDLAEDSYGFDLQLLIYFFEFEFSYTLLPLFNFFFHFIHRNYVMQFLVKRKKMEVNSMLISRLRYRYIRLSKNKYASNVVEELLRYSGADNVAVIARELMKSPEFLNLVQHPYGNYVVQRAVKYTEVWHCYSHNTIP